MATPFHAGEIEVQTRAGVRQMAAKVGNGIHAAMPDAAQEFLARQPLVFLGGADGTGRVWATVLTGPPGFARAADEQAVQIDARPSPPDPLAGAFDAGPSPVGLLALEAETRRRMRINGLGEVRPGGLTVRAEQVYANCPKYIQARAIEPTETIPNPESSSHGLALTDTQQAWIAKEDTFFLASVADGSADVSHRGGSPGFVRVDGPTHLTWPDYSGNTMFNSLGNLAADGRAGLLFVDFETGATLQLTGRAEVVWDTAQAAAFPGAERLVTFTLEEAVEVAGPLPISFRFLSASPFNPR